MTKITDAKNYPIGTVKADISQMWNGQFLITYWKNERKKFKRKPRWAYLGSMNVDIVEIKEPTKNVDGDVISRDDGLRKLKMGFVPKVS